MMIIKILIIKISFSIILSCTNIKPTIASDCWVKHSKEKACCYTEFYLNKNSFYPSQILCSELKPHLAITGIKYDNKRNPQFYDCGRYEEQYGERDLTLTCGPTNPNKVEDCSIYSTPNSRCCFIVNRNNNFERSCFESGNPNRHQYSNKNVNFSYDVDCIGSFYNLNFLFLFIFLIFFY